MERKLTGQSSASSKTRSKMPNKNAQDIIDQLEADVARRSEQQSQQSGSFFEQDGDDDDDDADDVTIKADDLIVTAVTLTFDFSSVPSRSRDSGCANTERTTASSSRTKS